MKTRKNIYFKVVALAVIAIAFAMPAKAQLSDNGYAVSYTHLDVYKRQG